LALSQQVLSLQPGATAPVTLAHSVGAAYAPSKPGLFSVAAACALAQPNPAISASAKLANRACRRATFDIPFNAPGIDERRADDMIGSGTAEFAI
jgi:hypothetical protein